MPNKLRIISRLCTLTWSVISHITNPKTWMTTRLPILPPRQDLPRSLISQQSYDQVRSVLRSSTISLTIKESYDHYCCFLKQRLNRRQANGHRQETLILSKCCWHEPRAARLTNTLSLFCFCVLVTSKLSHGVNKSCITQHVVAQGGYAYEVVRNSQNIAWRCRKKFCIFFFFYSFSTACWLWAAWRRGTGGHIKRNFAWMFWLPCLAEVILLLESDHMGRERERDGGGGVRDWAEPTAGVNFAFSSMPNDMHAEERQARLERELKCNCKSEESDEAQRSVPTSCLGPLQSRLGFSHISIFSQSAEWAARAAPNGVKKGATFLLVFRWLNHTASSRKAFNGVQKGQVHSKKRKPSKKHFCGWSTPGSPPAGLKVSLQSCTQNRPSPKVQSRSGDWI